MRIGKHVLGWAVAIVVILAIVCFVVPMFVPWSPLNSRHEDVDLNTGRLRFSRYLLFCRVSERIEDSSLSRAIPPGALERTEANWRRVNTFSPGVGHSPHYRFHGAIAQIRMLSVIWARDNYPTEVRQKTAQDVLALWRHADSYFLAGKYISGLDMTDAGNREEFFGQLMSLKMPFVEQKSGHVVHTVFFPSGKPMDRFEAYLDKDGDLVKDGLWEMWYANGKRQLHGHYKDGRVNGRRFQWGNNGKLSSIEYFRNGTLTEYEGENLEEHPDFGIAQQLISSDAQ